MTTDDQEIVSQLLDGLEERLPVSEAARSRSRATALAAFDEVVASRSDVEVDGTWVEWEEGDDPPNVHRLEPQAPHRGRWPLLVAAAVALLAGVVGASLLLPDPSDDDDLQSVAGDDAGGEDVFVDDAVSIDGVTFRAPDDLELVSSGEGRLTFASTEELTGGSDVITVVVVAEWSQPLRIPSMPPPDAPESLRDWLADSPTERSTLGFVESLANGATIEAWLVRLGASGAAGVGCPPEGSCGEVAVGSDGKAISLRTGLLNELISIEFPDGRPVLLYASYPDEGSSGELVTADLARSIAAGFSAPTGS